MKNTLSLNLLLCAALLCLPACGVKPKQVEAPEAATEDSFPRTYPDPSTDPKAQ